MNRREFLRRGALFVPATAIAIEEARSGLLTRWVRKLFPGFGPGTLRPVAGLGDADAFYAGGMGGGKTFAELDALMRKIYAEPLGRDLLNDSTLLDLFARDVPGDVDLGGGMYIEVAHDFGAVKL